LESKRIPAAWLFYGWNCTAKMLSRAMAQVKATPEAQDAAVSPHSAGAGK
jgi:hypothetical protein